MWHIYCHWNYAYILLLNIILQNFWLRIFTVVYTLIVSSFSLIGTPNQNWIWWQRSHDSSGGSQRGTRQPGMPKSFLQEVFASGKCSMRFQLSQPGGAHCSSICIQLLLQGLQTSDVNRESNLLAYLKITMETKQCLQSMFGNNRKKRKIREGGKMRQGESKKYKARQNKVRQGKGY